MRLSRIAPKVSIGILSAVSMMSIIVLGSAQGLKRITYPEVGFTSAVPQNVLTTQDLPSNLSQSDRDMMTDKRITVEFAFRSFYKIRSGHPTAVSSGLWDLLQAKSNVTRKDVLSLFEANQRFVLSENKIFANIEGSYEPFTYDGKPIGEWVFSAQNDGLLTVSMIYYDYKMTFAASMPEFFEFREGDWHWKTEDSVSAFYDAIRVGKQERLPPELSTIDMAWHVLLQNVKLR